MDTDFNFPALKAARDKLETAFKQAGTDMDLSKVTVLKGVTTADKVAEIKALNEEIDQLEQVAKAARRGGHEFGSEPGAGDRPAGGLKDAARRTLDVLVKTKALSDRGATLAETVLNDPKQQGLSARWVVAAGNPDYESAVMKMFADPQRGHMMWSPKEQAAYQQAETLHRELKAMSTTDSAGGYMIPLTLDPAIMLTSDGSTNPLRQLARVVHTLTNGWQGVTSAGATAEWKAEAAEASDGSPVLDEAPIPVHAGDVDVPYSYEVEMDAVNFRSELASVMQDAANQLQAAAYTTGSGSGQPTGIITALAGTASEINSGGSEALAAADVFTLQNALPARFSPRAQWMANLATINTLRQMETTNGALKFPELADGRLLGRAMNENSNMDGSVNAAATASNYLLVYGDFSNFVIVDRLGSTIEILPGYGANRRPTAQRHAFLFFRTGSDVTVANGFRMLDVPTTA
ncbi:phage major capsid protein [Actinoplanes sp. NPDC051411]|uniref:phage major capsid protein n=1 Tax=Actinoplanes sp. NPDC051411 TaxID=3155522 RepID=UPI003428CAF8